MLNLRAALHVQPFAQRVRKDNMGCCEISNSGITICEAPTSAADRCISIDKRGTAQFWFTVASTESDTLLNQSLPPCVTPYLIVEPLIVQCDCASDDPQWWFEFLASLCAQSRAGWGALAWNDESLSSFDDDGNNSSDGQSSETETEADEDSYCLDNSSDSGCSAHDDYI